MRNLLQYLLLSLCFSLCAVAAAGVPEGDASEWPSAEGGNGHHYQLVQTDDAASWHDARALAEDALLFGARGHLATITSEAENGFVRELVRRTLAPIGELAPVEVWLGGYQPEPGAEPGEGWEWVTGEDWEYSNWTEGEPNDFEGTPEDYLGMWVPGDFLGLWNDDVADSRNTDGWYVVEWDVELESRFVRGDANGDGRVDIADAIYLLDWLFRGGPEPGCPDAADANDSGEVDISDAIRLLTGLFGDAGPFPPPYPGCGVDPTPDGLRCDFPDKRLTGGSGPSIPDVCDLPVPPFGPVPIPYPNLAESGDRGSGGKTVKLVREECRAGRRVRVISEAEHDGEEGRWVETSVEPTGEACE